MLKEKWKLPPLYMPSSGEMVRVKWRMSSGLGKVVVMVVPRDSSERSFCTRSWAAVTFFFLVPRAPSAVAACCCCCFYKGWSVVGLERGRCSGRGSFTIDHIFNILREVGPEGQFGFDMR